MGESQEFSNLDSFNYCEVLPISGFVNKSNFNPFDFRPLSVTMSIKLNQISALCLLFEEDLVDPPCEPMVFIETLAFEMKKQFDQTRLQLFLSPAILRCVDKKLRYTGNENLHDGQIILRYFCLSSIWLWFIV